MTCRALPRRLPALYLMAISGLVATAAGVTPPLRPARPVPLDIYVVTVAADNIVVRRHDGTISFSARAFAAAQQAALQQARDRDLATVQHRFSVVSLAGPYLALRDQVAINIASPIPGGSTRLWTIDLRQPATYRFGDEEPLQPLPGDRTLVDLRQFYSPGTLAAAIGATRFGAPFKASPAKRDLRYVLSDLSKRGMAPNCYAADAGVTSSFAVVGKTAARLEVRLGLPGQPSCRYALTPLDIDLPSGGPLAAAIGSDPVSLGRDDTATISTSPGRSPTTNAAGGRAR